MSELGAGSVLDGRLRLVELIGTSATGTVWRAADERSGREVAVKTLPTHYADDAAARARFQLVARMLPQLSHPAITQVYEYGSADFIGGTVVPYVVREFVSGQTLRQRLDDGQLPAGEVLRILGTLADALAVAHRAGQPHGNIEPTNIVLGPAGIKITDFGLAALRRQPSSGPRPYGAPELASGSTASPASDMYSLGVLFIKCLTGTNGTVPGAGETGADASDTVPASLAALWAACLSANPQDRPSAAHVAVMSRQIPVAPAPAPAVSRTAAGRAEEPPAEPPKALGRVRPPRWHRGFRIALGGTFVALIAVAITLAQLPVSPVIQNSWQPARSPAATSSSSSRPPETGSASGRPAISQVTSSVTATTSAPVLTPLDAISELSATIQHGVTVGQIRQDVGVDFENFIRPAQAELVAGLPANVPQLVATLRAKLAQRISEGAVAQGIAQLISSELDTLLVSAAH